MNSGTTEAAHIAGGMLYGMQHDSDTGFYKIRGPPLFSNLLERSDARRGGVGGAAAPTRPNLLVPL